MDRVIAGLCAGFMRPIRLVRSSIVLNPATILGFHRALVKRKNRLLTGAIAVSTLFCCIHARNASSDQLLITAGGGSQPGSDQTNTTLGIDYSFFQRERSTRQHFLVGIGYTYLHTNTEEFESMYAISLYPQLNLYPAKDGKFAQRFPNWAFPFFFVRALAPSYISSNQLGDRKQDRNFAFQAQVGVGLLLDLEAERRGFVSISWKHFSNANLFKDNDGIDLPLVISLGLQF